MRSLACPARRIKLLPSASSSVSNAPVAQCIARRASNAEVAGESPAWSAKFTGMWLNPNSRGSRLRIWQPWGCNSLHAHHFPAPGLRGNSRPQRLKIAEPSGCKFRGADQPSLVELRLGKPACGSQGIADRFGSNPNSLGSASLPTPTNFGMSTGQANRASVLTSACLRASGASPRHSASPCKRPPLRA